MSDDARLRTTCFRALDTLRAVWGDELPYLDPRSGPSPVGGLEQGFLFEGERVPFFSVYKGIFRAGRQRGAAALSVMTSANSPYDDAATEDGFHYAYRDGSVDIADNRALRAAHETGEPIVYFVGVRPWVYEALYPCFVVERDDVMRRVLITPPSVSGTPSDEDARSAPDDPLEKRYATRTTVQRLHQHRFRGRVLPAYENRCTICSLKEARLLDAAHIVADSEIGGSAEVSNGLSLCSIHHRAFDSNLIGVSPDYRVAVSRRLREDEDGPMLELLKGFHGASIGLPRRRSDRPDRERLAERFDAVDA